MSSSARHELHHLTSRAVARKVEYHVWRPRPREGVRHPLVVVLHGANASAAELAQRLGTELTELAAALALAIVAVDGGNGWWLDGLKPGTGYATLLTAEFLPALTRRLPLTGALGLAGYSMGGHGALSAALDHPGRVRSVSALSGAFDLTLASDRRPLVAVLGPLERDPSVWHRRSVLHRLTELAAGPAGAATLRGVSLRLGCGRSDRWLEVNRAVHVQLQKLELEHAYHEHDGGHDWAYWGPRLQADLRWHRDLLEASGSDEVSPGAKPPRRGAR